MSFVRCCLLFVVSCFRVLFVVCCSLFDVRRSLFVVRLLFVCLLLVGCNGLFGVCCLLFAVRCCLLVACSLLCADCW